MFIRAGAFIRINTSFTSGVDKDVYCVCTYKFNASSLKNLS